jgi:hypothetical protein
LRDGVGGRFVGRLGRGSGGGRGRPGHMFVSWWFAIRRGEKRGTNDFDEREVMQVCAPCPNP